MAEREKEFFPEEEISDRNRRILSILDVIRKKGPLSRMDISKNIGVNPVTISNYIDHLMSQDLIYEKEFSASTGGRRPMLLDINSQAGYAIGVGINLSNAVGVLVDLEGNVVFRYKKEGGVSSVNEILETVIAIITSLIENNPRRKNKIKGIGIGIGGIVDKKKGIIRWPQKVEGRYNYSYISMPLKKFLEDKFSLPVFIDNDSTLACFAEYWVSLDTSIKNVIYMFSGVGVGFILNGDIYTGVNGCAGEIFVNVDGVKDNYLLGNVSFLKNWDKDFSLVEKVRSVFPEGRVNTLDDVFVLARINLQVKTLVNKAVEAFSVKVAFLVNLLNPEVVVIGGGLEKAGFELIEKINYFVRKYAFDEMTKDLRIVPSSLGDEAVARGAGSLVLKNMFTYI